MTKNTPAAAPEELGPKIVVIGVGGAGGNAVNNMIRSSLEGVTFVTANTDAQALKHSLVDPDHRVQLGVGSTQGLGAGSKPEVGKTAAEESAKDIAKFIENANMVFITAGMGGGTGTGAAPVIAKIARDAGVLTVGVVTKPFSFEGAARQKYAEAGIEELQQFVDTLLVIPNQNLFRLANENTTFADAFKLADNVLYSGVRGVTDLMLMPGLINLDFADIRTVMSEMGKAMMGTGESEGDRRALDAAESAISNPLLDDVSLQGARGILINITGGYDMTLYEVDEAANRIKDEVDPDANIIFGSTFDEKLNGKIRVSVVATGIGGFTPQPTLKASRDPASSIFSSARHQSQVSTNKTLNFSENTQSTVSNSFTQQNNGSRTPSQSFQAQESNIYSSESFDDVPPMQEPRDDFEGTQENNAIQNQKRKTKSFFDRFRSSKSFDDYEQPRTRRYQTHSSTMERAAMDDSLDSNLEDFDIPACFRKENK